MVSVEDFAELQRKLAVYEAQQVEATEAMKVEVAARVDEVANGLRELYTKAEGALMRLGRRVEELESSGGGGGRGQAKSLLHPKTWSWKSWIRQMAGDDGKPTWRTMWKRWCRGFENRWTKSRTWRRKPTS